MNHQFKLNGQFTKRRGKFRRYPSNVPPHLYEINKRRYGIRRAHKHAIAEAKKAFIDKAAPFRRRRISDAARAAMGAGARRGALVGPSMAERGRMGGLKTKTVKRKKYVTGRKHGNYGRRKPPQPIPRDALLRFYAAKAAYYLKHKEAPRSLTWKPPTIKDIRILDRRGYFLPPRLPRGREEEDTG